jgi:hypothetical protein
MPARHSESFGLKSALAIEIQRSGKGDMRQGIKATRSDGKVETLEELVVI